MTAKEYLGQIRKTDADIKDNIALLEQIKGQVTSTGGFHTDSVRVQTSRKPDQIGSMTGKIVDLENEIKKQISDLWDVKQTITGQIQALNNMKYIKVLCMRYVDLKTYQAIADSMGYTSRYILYLHGQALKGFESLYSDILNAYEKKEG